MPTGVSLRSAIDAKRRLDELGTARWVEEAATAVHKAQSGGQPIGKLAPEAILIRDGKVVVEPLANAVTAYTAPERLRGGPGDRRSDVFSLGVILWEALAHSRLFEGPEDFVRNAVERGDIPPVSELNANVPHELDAICKKALARDPADRYQSAKVMAAEISSVLEDAGYPDGVDAIATWAAKEVPDTKPANPNQTTMGLPPMMKQPAVVTDATMPLTATDIIPLETKKADVVPLEVRKAPAPTPAPVSSTPSSLPSWAQRPGGTQPPPTSTLQGPAIPKQQPAILTAPPAAATPAPVPRGAQLAEALARAKPGTNPPPAATDPLGPTTKAPALEPANSQIVTEPGINKLPNHSTTQPGITGPLVPAPPILPAAMTPASPAAAIPPVQSSPVLKLPDMPPGATVTADKPAVYNGSTTAIVGSSISTAIPTTGGTPQPFSGNRTAVLGSNAIIEAVNAAVSAANPPVAEARPVPLVPNPPILPASVVGTPAVKISEAETVNTPAVAVEPPREGATVKVTPSPALLAAATPGAVEPPTVPNHKVAELAAKLPAPADDDFAESGSGPSMSVRKTTPTAAASSAASASPSSTGTRPRRATSQNDARRKGDVLQGWGWGTDSHTAMEAAISGDDDAFEEDRRTHKKRMIMIFGGLGGAVVLVLVIAFAFSGGKKTDDSVAQKPNEQLGVQPPPPEPPKPEPPKVEPPRTEEPVKTEGSAEPPKPEGSATEPAKPEPPKTEPAKTEPGKTEPPKTPPKPDVQPAKVEPKKPDPPKIEPKKPDPRKPDVVVKKDPPKPPVIEPAKPKVDAGALYRTGFQQFAKGELQPALESFKQSLAADRGYAPTWRGIGMVYEKLGQKARAVTAFKKYLELAPGASDADSIKARLERLGS